MVELMDTDVLLANKCKFGLIVNINLSKRFIHRLFIKCTLIDLIILACNYKKGFKNETL